MNPKPFNPDDYDCEVLGFYEEFTDAETHKLLGIRLLTEPGRPLGSDGRLHLTLTEPLQLLKGYKREPVIIKATKQFPRKVTSMVQVICGRTKEQLNRK